jgi:hypothetical protein
MREKPTNTRVSYSFSLLIMYGSSYVFREYVALRRERGGGGVGGGAVGGGGVLTTPPPHHATRMSWMGHPQYSIDCSSIEHLRRY